MASHEYDRLGVGYHINRRPDPAIAARILGALGDAKTILNIGAGTGSYEPFSKHMIAVEPSLTMILQRPPISAPCVQALAEALPFANASFDAAMGVLTVHHWSRLAEGLQELRRVTSGKIVMLTWDPQCEEHFWLTRDYFPEILALDRARFPSFAVLEQHLGPLQVQRLMIPADCADGFRSAYWKRPQAYLDPEVRRSISSFAQFDAARGTARLAADLVSGEWTRRNHQLELLDELDVGYRIVTSL